MKDNIGFVLLPGGGMSKWIWEKIDSKLKLPYIALDKRINPNTYENRKNATLETCIEYIIETIDKAPFEKSIIVGHSGAGALAANVGKSIPDKIKHIIYIAANIPKHNATMMDGLPFLLKLLNIIAVRKMIKKDSIPYKKIEKTVREKFCNTCDEETIKYVLEHELLSEPLCVLSERMDWTAFPTIPQTYITLLNDHTLSIDKQKNMAGNLNITDIKTIESDHMVMVSHPEELATIMNSIAGL